MGFFDAADPARCLLWLALEALTSVQKLTRTAGISDRILQLGISLPYESENQLTKRLNLTPWCLVAIAPVAIAGCSGAFVGHLAVLAVTACIFLGTLSLGRARPVRSGAVPRPTDSSLRLPQI